MPVRSAAGKYVAILCSRGLRSALLSVLYLCPITSPSVRCVTPSVDPVRARGKSFRVQCERAVRCRAGAARSDQSGRSFGDQIRTGGLLEDRRREVRSE